MKKRNELGNVPYKAVASPVFLKGFMCHGCLVYWIDQIANKTFLFAKERDVARKLLVSSKITVSYQTNISDKALYQT